MAGRSGGFNKLPAIMAAFPDALEAAASEIAKATAREYAADAPRDTGELAGSVQVSRGADGDDIDSFSIDVVARHAAPIEFGPWDRDPEEILIGALLRNRGRFIDRLNELEKDLPK